MNVRTLAATRVTQPIAPEQRAPNRQSSSPGAKSFAGELAAHELKDASGVRVSAHAAERMQQRDIQFSQQSRAEVAAALTELEKKGARNALLLSESSAFVVSVPNRTIVTAIANNEVQSRAFTNIDSAYVMRDA